MSTRFWTADMHLGHCNILRYCKRPGLKASMLVDGDWASRDVALEAVQRHNEILIRNSNERVKKGDLVVHAGDFAFKGTKTGEKEFGIRHSAEEYLEQLQGHWHLIEGNHDGKNSVRAVCESMQVRIGSYRAFVAHHPMKNASHDMRFCRYLHDTTDFQICGHVHAEWEYQWYRVDNKKYLVYNVGVDVQNYRPISDAELIRRIDQIKHQAADVGNKKKGKI